MKIILPSRIKRPRINPSNPKKFGKVVTRARSQKLVKFTSKPPTKLVQKAKASVLPSRPKPPSRPKKQTIRGRGRTAGKLVGLDRARERANPRSALIRKPRKPLGKILFGRRKKKVEKGLRSKPRPERKQPQRKKEFGSDFNIFSVSKIGRGQDERVQVTKRTTRTNRAGAKKRSGIPQSASLTRVSGTKTRKARVTARTSLGRGQREKSSRTPLNTRSGEIKREFRREGSDFDIFRVAGELPAFIPRQLAKPNSPLRQALAFTPAGQAGKFLSERVSNKPLAQKDRALGSDFDILNFFG